MNEIQRRATIDAELKGILDAAKHDLNFATNVLRAQLYVERYQQNEVAKARYNSAMTGLVQVLSARIEHLSFPVARLAWQTSVMPAAAYETYHRSCYSKEPPHLKGDVEYLPLDMFALDQECDICGRLLFIESESAQ